jgi:hypothetical protein
MRGEGSQKAMGTMKESYSAYGTITMKVLAILLVGLLGSSTATMAGKPFSGIEAPIVGMGAATCKAIMAELVPAIQQQDTRTVNEIRMEMRQWALGYVVGYQHAHDIALLDGTEQKHFDRLLQEGCLAHPDWQLGQVVLTWIETRVNAIAQLLAKPKKAR